MSENGGALFGGLEMKTDEPEQESSGFSFLATDSMHASDVMEDQGNEPASGFSFLAAASDAVPETSDSVSGSSGFDFLVGSANTEPAKSSTDDLLSLNMAPNNVSQPAASEVKLAKVKKKKRVPKVGYEREGAEDEEAIAPASQPETVPSIPPQNAAPTTVQEVIQDVPPTPEPVVEERVSEESAAMSPEISSPASEETPANHDTSTKRKSGTFMNTLFRRKDKSDSAVAPTSQPAASGIRKLPEQIEHAASGHLFHRTPNKAEPPVEPVSVSTRTSEPISDVKPQTQASSTPEKHVKHAPVPIVEKAPVAVSSPVASSMFDGMSAATPPKAPAETVRPAPAVHMPIVEAKSAPPVHKPIVDAKPATDICSEIKKLAGDVIATFDKESNVIVERFQYLVAQLSSIRATLLSHERNERVSHQKLNDMEAEQIRLGEIEDFESADALTHAMESLRSELQAQAAESRELRNTLIRYEEEITTLNNTYARLLDSSLRGLKNLRRQQAEEVDTYFGQLESKVKEDNARVTAEEERLAIEWQHVEREETALNEESETIEHAIASQTKEHQESKSDMDMRLLGVSSEIRNLEKALAEKRAEEKQLKEELRSVEQKINDVRKKYDRQLLRINDRTVALSAVQQECRKEEEIIRREREAVNAATEKIQTSKRDLTEWMMAMDADVSVMAEVMESFALGRSLPVSGVIERGADAQSVNPELEKLRNRYIEAEASLQEAVTQQKELETTKVSLVAEDRDIDSQIPQLEAEKKDHATNKRFKEAAEVVKTIKQLASRKEEIQAHVDEITAKAEQMSLCVGERKSHLSAIEDEIKESEKASDMQKLAQIRAAIVTLKKFRYNLTKKYQSSGGTLLTSNLRLVDAELSVLVQAGLTIISKHDLPNPDINMEECVFEEEPISDAGDGGDEQVGSADNAEEVEPEAAADACDDVVCAVEESDNVAEIVEQSPDEDTNDVETSPETPLENAVPDVAEDPSIAEAERHTRMLEAKELLHLCTACEEKLNRAVDEEDYDEAASLSEELDTLKAQVSQVLVALGCSKQEVLSYEEPQDD